MLVVRSRVATNEIEDVAVQAPPSTAPLYSSGPDGDEESLFAAALRKAAGKHKR
ncbi:MAG: hypothetical protein M3R24_16125 [Chloroflexota bacterium]|nr:hypothetical protein [Chloroflexota bacterium]